MQTESNLPRWKRETRDTVADCRVFRVVRQRSRREGDGRMADWFVINTDDFVNVVATTRDKKIVLVRQFRHGSDGFSWELPGGMVDSGEDPEAAAIRELAEETGFVGSSKGVFAGCHPNPAIMDNRCHFVLVRDAEKTMRQNWDEHEEMEVGIFAMDELWQMVADGKLTHSLTLAALLHYSRLAALDAKRP